MHFYSVYKCNHICKKMFKSGLKLFYDVLEDISGFPKTFFMVRINKLSGDETA